MKLRQMKELKVATFYSSPRYVEFRIKLLKNEINCSRFILKNQIFLKFNFN